MSSSPPTSAPSARRRRVLIAVGLVLVIALIAGGIGVSLAVRKHPSAAGKPNIVFILTDDQRWDTLKYMPNVKRLLADRGVTFANSFVVNPLCCPSRASILTGDYSHTTGEWWNAPPWGGFPKFHNDHSTIATWLHDAGYRTALFGKYLNQYQGTTYVPPGWDHWVALDGSQNRNDYYYRYYLNVDGHLAYHGASPKDYSTNVLADAAVSYIRNTPGTLFTYFAPYGPHQPSTPAPGDGAAFAGIKPWRPPSYNQPDLSAEPPWVQKLHPMGSKRRKATDLLRQHMLESLLSEDRAVARIVAALAATGRLHDTMIVFASDNGFSWGEHRWHDKITPWEENIRVPLVVRYDPLTGTPRTDRHVVANIDYAPTFAQLAGVDAPGAEGMSFLPLLQGRTVTWRTYIGIEGMGRPTGKRIPAFCGVRTSRYALTDYGDGGRELFDLSSDPYELSNLAAKPAQASLVAQLDAQIRRLCNPPPPTSPKGFPP